MNFPVKSENNGEFSLYYKDKLIKTFFMKKFNHFFLLVGILLFSSSCANFGGYYNQLNYQKNQASSKKGIIESEKEIPRQILTSDTKNLNSEELEVPYVKAVKVIVDQKTILEQKIVDKLAKKSNLSLKSMKSPSRSFVDDPSKDTLGCSTIVLVDGRKILAQKVKVSFGFVVYTPCGGNQELRLERSSVDLIQPPTKEVNNKKEKGKERFLKRFSYLTFVLYFILTVALILLTAYLIILEIYGIPAILTFLAAGVGLLLLTLFLTDEFSQKGITFLLTSFVLNACAAIVNFFLYVDYVLLS